MGLSSISSVRICAMTAGSWSSPAMTRAGSPGMSCWRQNTSTLTRSRVGMTWAKRRPRWLPMLSLHVQSLQADHAVRNGAEALELHGHRRCVLGIVEIEDRQIGPLLVPHFLIERVPLADIGQGAGLIQRMVHHRVGVVADVVALPGMQEGIGVAIDIHAAGPADLIGLEVSVIGFLQG